MRVAFFSTASLFCIDVEALQHPVCINITKRKKIAAIAADANIAKRQWPRECSQGWHRYATMFWTDSYPRQPMDISTSVCAPLQWQEHSQDWRHHK